MTEFQYLDGGNSEAQDRLATSFLLAQASVGLARTGVLAGLAVTQTPTASGSVLIAAGAAPVQASVGTGVALLVNDTSATLDVFTANPMGGLPRRDIVAFDMLTKAIIVIVGNPDASPSDPAVPATACALARLRHSASATTIPTSAIDDLRVYTALAGAGVTYHADPAVGGTFGAAVVSGITAGVTIAASGVDRLIRGGFGAEPSSGGGADSELQVYRDGSPIRRASGLAVNAPRAGTYAFTLPAGVSTSLGMVVATGSAGMTVGTDGDYIYHDVTSEPVR